ncbi:MAG: hypothetical protein LBS93_08930 [Synergistaceae bacterium]|jgi:hypothetical protein|nr:hypothetical protein [Synergistaceae bacterium]
MLGKGLPNAGIIYRDVVITSVQREGGNLRLRGIEAGRRYLNILYEDVLHSQIGTADIGLRVTLVEELTFDEFSEVRHNMGRNRMLRDEQPDKFANLTGMLSQGDCRVYAHYLESPGEECLVLARSVRIEGSDERIERKEEENREYRFYAFVSHEEGGRDEKCARWLRRRLENYRIPVETVSRLRRESAAITEDTIPSRLAVGASARTFFGYPPEEPAGPGSVTMAARYLIVICSPRAAKSERVNEDVKEFVESGKEDYIIPFIIDGEPAGDGDRCYPPCLLSNSLGVTLSAGTGEEAVIQVMARLLRVKFSRLYQRHLREQRRVLVRLLALASVVLSVLAVLASWAVSSEITAARRREEADGMARFLVEDMQNEEQLPAAVRSVIDEKVREYYEKRS